MSRRYGRAQFLRDARSLGVSVRLANSRTALRRERDRLIREHHPDLGGSNDRAREINDVYARMVKWLDARDRPETDTAVPAMEEPAPSAGPPKRFLRKAVAATLWAVTLIASSYVVARTTKRP